MEYSWRRRLLMAGFEEVVKKAFYMGIGFASYATEKAGATLNELRTQAEKLADEMVQKGEITTEEARKFVDDLIKQAQQESVSPSRETTQREPRRIEIISDEEESQQPESNNVNDLRQQVESLQEELRRLKKE
jgi:polyhydroxyalkanoate synthesis regulator phasin